MASKKPSYVPQPDVPESLEERYRVTLMVLGGMITVSEGARRLGLSRVQYQTLFHRGLHGLIDGLSPKLPGRPPKSPEEERLSEENEQLRRENQKLQQRAESIERMLTVASELVRARSTLTSPRRARSKKTTPTSTPEGSDDEDPRKREVRRLRSLRMRSTLVAATAGVSVATIRRWNARPPARVSIPRRSPEPPACATAHVEQLVRELRGLVGAEALSHAVPGVSRRQAARIKHATLTAMECERQANVARLTVIEPGVMRGFDAMHVPTTEGRRYVLCAGDASVPYRTSLDVVDRYDEHAVLDAIANDLEAHGAPLVWRMDRASVHRTPAVRELLAANDVLILHGPAHYPGFYGQLERQNREHRAWLQQCGPLDPDALEDECAAMLVALNDRWPRRTLRWQTAGQAWRARMAIRDDRKALGDEVHARTARIERDMTKPDSELASRLAIEQVLTKRGYLQRELGGWC